MTRVVCIERLKFNEFFAHLGHSSALIAGEGKNIPPNKVRGSLWNRKPN